MAADVSYFGIRHHGPGSARRLVEALDALQPRCVLIEGPVDASDLLPMLAAPDMVLPVALLTYAEDAPATASFFPFAEYSPEYQAVIWAVRHGIAARLIDLPAADRLSPEEESSLSDAHAAVDDPIAHDPIGALAQAAGYDDGESWWRDVIEENSSTEPVFAAVTDAMTALRAETKRLSPYEAAREAHMRLEIAKAAKDSIGPVAVVCGAWHVPALVAKHSATADRELLKGRNKTRIKATWAPWTTPRLARDSGYGAGVVAPGWCQHVWDTHGTAVGETVWLAQIARLMRDKGHSVSTASVIETQRLGTALAALRERPAAGFEELRDAAIACMCFGERALWNEIAADLLIGSGVGAIPAATPLAPLLEDLQRQQKATRLKPESLERELAVDLRSDSGLARSTLLHRLAALDVPWGRSTDVGRSRGTFRENWLLCWEPEFAVRLVEHLVYGSTIAEAASGRIMEAMRAEPDLGTLAGLVRSAMVADLPVAIDFGIDALEQKAALTSEAQALLRALPPMADVVRYGEARAGAAQHLAALMPRIIVQAALALPYAVRALDAEATAAVRGDILGANGAIQLAALDTDTTEAWHQALRHVLDHPQTTRVIAGVAARLLYAADLLTADEAAHLLVRMLSPGTPVADAAGFFDGFFEGAGQRLIHDGPLRAAVDGWLMTLDDADFTSNLPLFRRVFSALDKAERRRMMDALFGRTKSGADGYRLLPGADALWPAHFDRVMALMTTRATR
ncbi:MAG: hypothetical protein K2W81_15315 [Sphingomonas sp.]|uniref:DUF5682 family protein n=1 Tax=Sphingomonas sp. TaxID=28214 RepID=UPI0025D992F3|nr:DUF5682 family protein [Sphingomonas sp.]MBY0285318.1 hypothetical protein [Sphingomonas sp.]